MSGKSCDLLASDDLTLDLQILDLLGLKCPLPVIKTRKALRSLKPRQMLEVLTSDPLSAIDIPNLVREEGDVLEQQQGGQGRFCFLIRKRAI